jgi:hypothetical protein
MGGSLVGGGTVGNAVKIDGLKELQAQLKKLPKDVSREFNREMKGIAAEVTGSIHQQMSASFQDNRSAKKKSAKAERPLGDAEKSVRPSFANGYVAIRGGGERAPYYPWLDFGGTLPAVGGRHNEQHRPFFHEGRWIYPTIARRRPQIYAKAMAAVERAKGRVGL